MKKILFLFLTASFLIFSFSAKAVCPVCTIAVCAGVGLSRWLKIDDVISGIWIGGLAVSAIIWVLDWLQKKQIKFNFKKIIVSLAIYAAILLPLYFSKIIGYLENKILGVDRLLFGIGLGTIVFIFSVLFNEFLKKKNNNKVYFPFQKLVIPIVFLLAVSLIFYFSFCP